MSRIVTPSNGHHHDNADVGHLNNVFIRCPWQMRVAFRGTLYSRAWQQRPSSDLNPIKQVLIAAGLRGGRVETGEAIPDRALMFVNSRSPILQPSSPTPRTAIHEQSGSRSERRAKRARGPRHCVCRREEHSGSRSGRWLRSHARARAYSTHRAPWYNCRSGATVPYFHTGKAFPLDRRAQRRHGIRRVLLHKP
jgi:hypothetical protein